MSRSIKAHTMRGPIANAHLFWFARSAKDGHFGRVPPRLERRLFRPSAYGDGIRRRLARIADPQKVASLVRERVAVILIKRTAAVLARINLQLQRAVRFLPGTLH